MMDFDILVLLMRAMTQKLGLVSQNGPCHLERNADNFQSIDIACVTLSRLVYVGL